MSKMIEMGNKYRTRGGKDVRVLCVDSGDTDYPVVAIIVNPKGKPDVANFTATGGYRCVSVRESFLDLVEVSPYEHLKIDDPVVVWDNHIYGTPTKVRRHFAGINGHGLPTTWVNGFTSYTSDNPTPWDNCVAFNAVAHAHISKGA